MLGWCAVLIKVYFFWKKTIALLQLLHYCNSFLGGQLLHIAIFNRFFDLYCYCYCNSSEHYCQCLDVYVVICVLKACNFVRVKSCNWNAYANSRMLINVEDDQEGLSKNYISITSFNIFFNNFYVIITIWSGMFMVKSQSMHHFMQNSSNIAQTMTRFLIWRS